MKSNEKLRSLTTELKLIEYWDTEYYKRTNRGAMEIEAFKIRRNRRNQILAQIALLEEALVNKDAEC